MFLSVFVLPVEDTEGMGCAGPDGIDLDTARRNHCVAVRTKAHHVAWRILAPFGPGMDAMGLERLGTGLGT